MSRSRSPLRDFSSQTDEEDFVDDVSEVPSDRESDYNSDSSFSPLFGEDTDSDPDYIPGDNEGRQGPSKLFRKLDTSFGNLSYGNVDTDETSEDEVRSSLIDSRPSSRPAENVATRPVTTLAGPSVSPTGLTMVRPTRKPRGRPRGLPRQRNTGRPRGRPRLPTVVENRPRPTSDSDSEDGTGWTNVEEGEDDFNGDGIYSFEAEGGIKHGPPKDSPPKDYFFLFFTVQLLDSFVKYTNLYAQHFTSNSTPSNSSRSRNFKPVNRQEMLAFIITLINMGLNPKPTIYMYWTRTSSQFIPWFTRMFNRNRFQCILKFFHMIDTTNLPRSGQPNYDPCERFQTLVDHVNRVSRHHYVPHEKLSIDESMVSTKGHSQLLQYMPKKRHRWGVKLWSLCDAVTHYCLTFFVYKGANNPEDKREINQNGLGYYVVVKLLTMTNLLQKGYHVFVDNFFTTINLAKYLYSRLTFFTGTMRANRKGIPQIMKNKFPVGCKKYLRKGPMLMLGYREKQSQKKTSLTFDN